MTDAREISNKLDLVGVQEVRWDGGGTERPGECTISMERGMAIMNQLQVFFVHKIVISAVKRVEFVSDRMSYIILRGRWCNVIVLNVHAPTEDKIDCVKDRFYEELEQVFDKVLKYHMKILLGDFNAKVGRKGIFKPTIGNESLNNDNGPGVDSASNRNECRKSSWW
jgi:hypothetical protein